MTVNHFVIMIKHIWKKDWHPYRHAEIFAQDHAAYMLFIYSSERVGTYFESNMRQGSGHRLTYELSGLTFKKAVKDYSNFSSRQLTLLISKI